MPSSAWAATLWSVRSTPCFINGGFLLLVESPLAVAYLAHHARVPEPTAQIGDLPDVIGLVKGEEVDDPAHFSVGARRPLR
jgi:hypothetical protein